MVAESIGAGGGATSTVRPVASAISRYQPVSAAPSAGAAGPATRHGQFRLWFGARVCVGERADERFRLWFGCAGCGCRVGKRENRPFRLWFGTRGGVSESDNGRFRLWFGCAECGCRVGERDSGPLQLWFWRDRRDGDGSDIGQLRWSRGGRGATRPPRRSASSDPACAEVEFVWWVRWRRRYYGVRLPTEFGCSVRPRG